MGGRSALLGLAGLGGVFVVSLAWFGMGGGLGATLSPVVASGNGDLARAQMEASEAGAAASDGDSEPRRRVTLRDLVAAVEPSTDRELADGSLDSEEPDWELLTVSAAGPRLDQRYDDGSALYEGAQIQDQDGEWVRHGIWNAWHENGQRWERGGYSNGVEDGPWDWWYENGNPMSSGVFRDGERVGPWSWWYPDGRLMMTGSHDEDGLGQGRWTYWHANGAKAAEGVLVDGELSGRWYVWTEGGVSDPMNGGTYDEGERVGD